MKQIRYFLPVFFMLFLACSNHFENAVEESVLQQLDIYPESRLQDLYKNFFQDRFGPGHLIPDTAMAGEYLRSELAAYTKVGQKPLIEQIGWEKNFYRVSTDAVKMDLLPLSVYLDAFVESANTTKETPITEWEVEWQKILCVIERMNLNLPNFNADKIKIQKLIDSGEFAVHHSSSFEAAYQPHYRVIKKEIVENRIKPLLLDSSPE
ncbi:MAG: hypothetical protein LBU22_14155 [Dysgonamonadaceae bacterium]|jgi:hypothetical protein|nr:hypothetical protein [Dysgonamonadaceae bacterium]